MLGFVVEASGDRYCLCDREVTAEVVLARLSHLTGCDKVRLLEILQSDGDDWVVQSLRVGSLHGFRQLWHGLALDKNRANPFQGHITVRLHCYSLVEFGRQRKVQIEGVTFSELI